MSPSSTRTRAADGNARAAPSLGHLLLVWVLVGASLAGLGVDLHRAVTGDVPFAAVNTGRLFGTAVVASLWVAGFRPSVRASAFYFLTSLVVHLLLALAVLGPTSSPWQDAGVRALSIAVAAGLSFTEPGRRTRHWLRDRCRRLFESQAAG